MLLTNQLELTGEKAYESVGSLEAGKSFSNI